MNKATDVHQKPLVITIDGTAGSGKGTISMKLARHLKWHYLDSGALYRALALLYITYHSIVLDKKHHRLASFDDFAHIDQEIFIDRLAYFCQFDLNNANNLYTTNTQQELEFSLQLPRIKENILLALAKDMAVTIDVLDFTNDQDGLCGILNNRQPVMIALNYKTKNYNITTAIRTDLCSKIASCLAIIPEVRAVLLAQQHFYLQFPGLVADGRDMGTTVFPTAILKIFLDADPTIRAARRDLQLKRIGVNDNLQNRINELSERDLRDSQRVAAPLKPAVDAITIDTTTMTIDEVFALVMNQVNLIV